MNHTVAQGLRRGARALLLLLLSGGALLPSCGRGGPSRPPNIVVVVWDTCRPDRLSAYGYPLPTTPRLEEFARGAVKYEHAYSPAPWTPPSHASLFTGLLPARHGLTQREEAEGGRTRPGIPLLAETLAAAGYDTIGFSCNACISRATGLDRGFRTMTGLYVGEPVKGSGEKARAAVAEWIAERRRDPRAEERPLFLFLNLMDAHIPRIPSRASVAAVRPKGVTDDELNRAAAIDERRVFEHSLGIRPLDGRTLEAARVLYDGACRDLDAATGGILDLLRDEGILEGAFVAITGDHGEALGEHGEMGHRMSVHDDLLHIPLLVRWPGRLDGGRTERKQVRLQDLYPTILGAAGVAVPAGNGQDAVPLLPEPVAARPLVAAFHRAVLTPEQLRVLLPGQPESLFGQFALTHLAAQDPVAAPGMRYIRVLREEAGRAPVPEREELYDLAADPGETRNLLAPGGPPGARETADRLVPLAETGR